MTVSVEADMARMRLPRPMSLIVWRQCYLLNEDVLFDYSVCCGPKWQ